MYEEADTTANWSDLVDLASVINIIQAKMIDESRKAASSGEDKHTHASHTLADLLGQIDLALMPIHGEVH